MAKLVAINVITEKSRGEVSLVEQDTIENVSQANFFFSNFFKEKKITFILCGHYKVFNFYFFGP